MTTHFITAEIEINPQQEEITKTIEQELAKHGDPLRWAVVAVESTTNAVPSGKTTAHVEAVVTK